MCYTEYIITIREVIAVKKGFTLAELLIGLGIVGVLAALAGPAIMGFMPDKTKSSYIKTYNVLVNKVNDVVSDPELYWQTPTCSALGCSNVPTEYQNTAGALCNAERKLPTLLYNRLNTTNGIKYTANETNFTTTDGTVWTFTTPDKTPKGLYHVLNLDFAGGEGCTYNMFSCKKPTKFTFTIENSGNVVATDSMGVAYLRNSLDMRFTDSDKKLARSLSVKSILGDKKMMDALSEVQLERLKKEFPAEFKVDLK